MSLHDDPPFRSVRHAIRAAYASEVAEVFGRTPTVSYKADPKTDGPDGPAIGDMLVGSAIQERASSDGPKPQSYVTHFEHIAEGLWCMTLIRDTLDDDRMAVIDAIYTIARPPPERLHPDAVWLADDPALLTRRYAAIVRLADMVRAVGTYGSADADYVVAAVAEWVGLGNMNRTEWAEHLRVARRTLRYWRHGRGWHGVGIDDRLRVYRDEAEYRLETVMAARGLMIRPDEPICYGLSRDTRKGSASWSGLLSLRWRKPSDDERPSEAAAEVPDDRNRFETEHGRTGQRRSGRDVIGSARVRTPARSDPALHREHIPRSP